MMMEISEKVLNDFLVCRIRKILEGICVFMEIKGWLEIIMGF